MPEQNKEVLKIDLQCSNSVSYYHLQNNISPLKRLYIKNITQEDIKNVTVKITSNPNFILPATIEQELLPRNSTVKFEAEPQLSPLFMVAQNTAIDGEITVEVLLNKKTLATATQKVKVLAFDECDHSDHPEALATFVKRSHEINKLLTQTLKKTEDWKVKVIPSGYINGKNGVRNFFASAYYLLANMGFSQAKKTDNCQVVAPHKELISSKTATDLEIALFLASVLENFNLNAIIGKIKGNWYVGCHLSNECLASTVTDDGSIIRKKMDTGVNDLTLVPVADIFQEIPFEKAEKNAHNILKKSDDVEYFLDLKRARIMKIFPLPDRVKTDNGYDLVKSEDFATELPSQLKEYTGNIGGEKEISRLMQWERKLLDMDMRNGLLNFRISQTAVRLIIPEIESFLSALTDNKNFVLVPRPNDETGVSTKIKNVFERNSYLKPFSEFIKYEYKNKKLFSVFDGKEFESSLTRVYRKEKSNLEETGTATLYLSLGFIKWSYPDGEDKYAPVYLYPVTLTRKSTGAGAFSLEINAEEAQINSTLLEFLYQEFNIDMRGLTNVPLSDISTIPSILNRIKKEVLLKDGWEVLDNVFLSSLSFGNYLLWHDVKHKSEKFRQNPVINSLINNRLEFSPDNVMSDLSSDEAYTAEDPIYLPISADSSQYSAIADSLCKSFILHGPPGTGKSQTITNIIANNIVRGRRVLFVAEKMAALSVVHKRLKSIGIGDFCLELYSGKTDKNAILNQIISTLSLADAGVEPENLDDKISELSVLIHKLSSELNAVHKKRHLGFSLYNAMLNYFENTDAPDCLRIDSLFYERLTETSFNEYLEVLNELSLRARECGDIENSPFKDVGRFTYNDQWRKEAETILDIYLLELKHLRQYSKALLPLFNIRTVSLTAQKLDALYRLATTLTESYAVAFFANAQKFSNPEKTLDGYLDADRHLKVLLNEYKNTYGDYPTGIERNEVTMAINGNLSRTMRRILPSTVNKTSRKSYFEFLLKCEDAIELLKRRKTALASLFGITDETPLDEYAKSMRNLYDNAKDLYADLDIAIFNESCRTLVNNDKPNKYLQYYKRAYKNAEQAKSDFNEIFCITRYHKNEDVSATIEKVINIGKNIDYIPNWCRYQEIVEKCQVNGFEFVLEPLAMGEISADDILRCFKKCVYYNFVKSELSLDDVLNQFSGLTLEDCANKFKILSEEYEKLTRRQLYLKLVALLPRTDTVGEHNLERVVLMRAEKNNMKGTTLRNLFTTIPNILKSTCPCMLMSPTSVSQFLDMDLAKFDLVIFDEASQIPTCKAVGSIVRGDNVVIVGDPKQLPPTTFFRADAKDDEHYETEDLESILDDCLALGLPENHLSWHYRSNHESLIAFSNATFYDNSLLTFPSPNEQNSKVTFRYVDGVYERGGTKCNKKEADELISEIIMRLSSPTLREQSIGVVTFNTAQQNYIEEKLYSVIHQKGLDAYAFDVEEPIFVKNLENVQGDERDVILFSIGYGPDSRGKLSLNFGPINQSGGYKRLNVAVTRARTEMMIFSAITGNMIDLSRTDSKGVHCLKAFLEYAERGRDMLAVNSKDVAINKTTSIGSLIANDLKEKGILCDHDLGISDFKIDVAVIDPRDKQKYILAIICDGENAMRLKGVKDRVTMQARILKKLGWNTCHLWTVNYFNNPKREITKIKDLISTLTEKKILNRKTVKEVTNRYKVNYKVYYAKPMGANGAEYVADFVNEEKIKQRIRAIIETESPIEEKLLLNRLLALYNVPKTNKKAIQVLTDYMRSYASFLIEEKDTIYYIDKNNTTFRPNDAKITRELQHVHYSEIISACKCAIETKLYVTRADLLKEVPLLFNAKKTKLANEYIEECIDRAIRENELILTVDEYLTT